MMRRFEMEDKPMMHIGLELSPEKYLKSLHVKFTHSKTAYHYPPEPFIKRLRRFLGIKPKGNPFVKLEDSKR
jgi:hypothetical protein